MWKRMVGEVKCIYLFHGEELDGQTDGIVDTSYIIERDFYVSRGVFG